MLDSASHGELFLRSLECYFCIYFSRCFATREISTKITLSWALKQFVTRVHTLFCIHSNVVMQYFRDSYAITAVLNIHWPWHIETVPFFDQCIRIPIYIWVHLETPPLLGRYTLDIPRREGSGCYAFPDSKVNEANMGPIWGRQDPGGPHVGPMNFAIWVVYR